MPLSKENLRSNTRVAERFSVNYNDNSYLLCKDPIAKTKQELRILIIVNIRMEVMPAKRKALLHAVRGIKEVCIENENKCNLIEVWES